MAANDDQEDSPLLKELASGYCTCLGFPPHCTACRAQGELERARKKRAEKKR